MQQMMFKICDIMNQIKGFIVGYSAQESKMLFEVDGKRYVFEVREIEDPKPDILDDMRRIRYL
jgi:hypothetical protein